MYVNYTCIGGLCSHIWSHSCNGDENLHYLVACWKHLTTQSLWWCWGKQTCNASYMSTLPLITLQFTILPLFFFFLSMMLQTPPAPKFHDSVQRPPRVTVYVRPHIPTTELFNKASLKTPTLLRDYESIFIRTLLKTLATLESTTRRWKPRERLCHSLPQTRPCNTPRKPSEHHRSWTSQLTKSPGNNRKGEDRCKYSAYQ